LAATIAASGDNFATTFGEGFAGSFALALAVDAVAVAGFAAVAFFPTVACFLAEVDFVADVVTAPALTKPTARANAATITRE
jgi:hypothetical protein